MNLLGTEGVFFFFLNMSYANFTFSRKINRVIASTFLKSELSLSILTKSVNRTECKQKKLNQIRIIIKIPVWRLRARYIKVWVQF